MPSGWKSWRADDGRIYYQRPDGTTTWTAPEQPPPPKGDLTLTKYYHRRIGWADEFRLGGSLENRNSFFFQSDPQSDERVWEDIITELYLDAHWNPIVRTYGKMKMTGYLPQSDPRVRIIPQEAFLDLYPGNFDIRAGIQLFSWGAADLYNPTDRLNPRDYTDILNPYKEGILALKVAYTLKNWTLEGLWIPLPQESLLPEPGWRFFVPPTTDPTFNQQLVDLQPETSLKNPQFGARVRGTAGRFDLAFSYSYSFATVPQQEVVVGVFDPVTNTVDVTITEVFPREHVFGANLATTIKDISLHLETAATFPKETGHDVGSADQFRFDYVVGGNYIFNNVLGNDDIRFFLDFSQEIYQGEKTFNLNRIFLLSILSRIQYLFNDDLSLIFDSAFNLNDGDYVLRPKVAWGFHEGFLLTAGFDIINGSTDSFFGQFAEDDRAFLWLNYIF